MKWWFGEEETSNNEVTENPSNEVETQPENEVVSNETVIGETTEEPTGNEEEIPNNEVTIRRRRTRRRALCRARGKRRSNIRKFKYIQGISICKRYIRLRIWNKL